MMRKVLASRQQAVPGKPLSSRHHASAQTLLASEGSYQLEPAPDKGTRKARAAFCDLTVDRDWASLTVGSSHLPSEPDVLADLAAAGFEQPDPQGPSPSVRQWFRSWAFTTPSARIRAAEEILQAARLAFRLEADATLDVSASAALADPDPGGPIV